MPSREQLEKLLSKEPHDPFLNFGLAMELAKDEPKEAALGQFDRVLEVDPNYLAAYHQKGRLLLSVGRTEEARQVLRMGIEAAQRVGDAHAAGEMNELMELAC